MVKMTKVLLGTGIAVGVAAAGCLTRPVVSENPTTKTSFTAQVKQQSIDKVDILFMVDNSASMGDKQQLLADAVPVLVNRLVNPNCVATATSGAGSTCTTAADCTGTLGANAECDITGNNGAGQCFVAGDNSACSTVPNTKAEFDAVHDMHVGIVSSSLGDATPDNTTCPLQTNDSTHQNDAGHLLNRTWTNYGSVPVQEGSIANAKPVDGNGGNFLAWLPSANVKNQGKTPPNVTPYTDGNATTFTTDFQSLIEGVQQHGCGLEAQLESWYRFLIQPDPYQSISFSSSVPPVASYNGVDATLLKMRHDFLRPDSLVAVIALTDEEDSWSDPLWLGGYGWTARTSNFPGGPGQGAGPRGTSECDAPVDVNTNTGGPNDPDCVSCAFPGSNKPVAGTPIGQDSNCQGCAAGATTCQKGWYLPATTVGPTGNVLQADGLNVRYGYQYMRQRYGFDNQYNYQRYVDGLRLTSVPDSAHEIHDYTQYANQQRNCTNPLFANALPDGSDTTGATLCNLALGSRTPDLVFFAIIGGVPNQLLQDANGNFKEDLSSSDWQSILGKDPDHYIFDGIDPHMIESTAPRSGLQAPGTTYNLGTDPYNGREWNTLTSGAAIDLQYACTFALPTPKDCTAAVNQGACDCTGTASTDPGGPPLCDVATRTTQTRGKAYPTIRELRVAKDLGAQAVVASLCAQNVTGNVSDPTYGYNPAMKAIVDRLKNALSGQCLPEQLTVTNGDVPCLILVVYNNQTNQTASTACTDAGECNPAVPAGQNYGQPGGSCCATGDSTCQTSYTGILQRFAANYQASLGDSGASQPTPVACVFQQLTQDPNCNSTTCYSGNSCSGGANVGWCYVQGSANTGGCAQAIKFGGSGPPSGTTIDLECIEQSGVGGDAATE